MPKHALSPMCEGLTTLKWLFFLDSAARPYRRVETQQREEVKHRVLLLLLDDDAAPSSNDRLLFSFFFLEGGGEQTNTVSDAGTQN